MKVFNVLTALALVCLPTLAVANNLPFVGKRNFSLMHFDGVNGFKQIQISKNGSVKVYVFRRDMAANGKEYYNQYLAYQGRYKAIMNLGDGQYISILNKNQIAYTDKNGNIRNDCDMDETAYCIADLTRVR